MHQDYPHHALTVMCFTSPPEVLTRMWIAEVLTRMGWSERRSRTIRCHSIAANGRLSIGSRVTIGGTVETPVVIRMPVVMRMVVRRARIVDVGRRVRIAIRIGRWPDLNGIIRLIGGIPVAVAKANSLPCRDRSRNDGAANDCQPDQNSFHFIFLRRFNLNTVSKLKS